jgi:hypothetical protein
LEAREALLPARVATLPAYPPESLPTWLLASGSSRAGGRASKFNVNIIVFSA